MFIGHYAPALVAAARPSAAGLGTLFVAAQLVDIGFAVLLIPGIEAMRIVPGITAMNPMDLHHMPYTHSLLGALLWSALTRVLRELASNAIAHARATRVSVELRLAGDRLELRFDDDGIGRNPPSWSHGLGLAGVR